MTKQYPIPNHYKKSSTEKVWRVPYEKRAKEARKWAKDHQITPAKEDKKKIGLLLIDIQNTFCLPEFELFVGGRSGLGAVKDNQRVCQFIYQNLGHITQIIATMDTHSTTQLFHSMFLIDESGDHPSPTTIITEKDIQKKRWKINPHIQDYIEKTTNTPLKNYLAYYCNSLEKSGHFNLITWPYHAMLGGIGHALVSAIEEAIFFHTIARYSQPRIELKGQHPLTEHYSIISPEVKTNEQETTFIPQNRALIETLKQYDLLLIAGQAKSHCVAWTIQDFINILKKENPSQINKIIILEDTMSPVVIPNVIDFTNQTETTFNTFKQEGAQILKTNRIIL